MNILIRIFLWHLKFVYFFLKLFKTKEKVVFMSRLSNKESIDFKYLENDLKNHDIKVVVMCKKLDNYFSYYFHFYKQMYELATSKVCVVDSYIPLVSVLNHKKELKILQLWHSLGAIKKFGLDNLGQENGRKESIANVMKMHQKYTNIISCSNYTDKYYAKAFGYNKDVFLHYGLPRIDYLLKEKNKIKKKILKKYPSLANKKTILYAPTFRRDKEDKTEEIINEIDFNKYNIIIKSHPLHKLNINNDRIYKCKEFKAMDLLTVSDIVITDYSGIALEAYVLNKKVYYYLFDYEEYDRKTGLNVKLDKELPNVVFRDSKNLKKILSKNYPIKEVETYKNKYLETLDGNSTKLICNKIIEWIK